MIAKRHYIIKFSDLSKRKQEEILNDVGVGIYSDGDVKSTVLKDIPEDEQIDYIEGIVQSACDKSHVEWEIVVEAL